MKTLPQPWSVAMEATNFTVLLAWLFRKGVVTPFPIYLDSPMAIKASQIYLKHPELWHDNLKEIVRERPLREELVKAKSKVCVSADESRALNDLRGTCMILAEAGMCNARPHSSPSAGQRVETGDLGGDRSFQGRNTIGRALADGAKTVRIFGDKTVVRASVHSLGGFSAHAGQSDLLNWLAP
jgi:metallo-beta-lactamase family protein